MGMAGSSLQAAAILGACPARAAARMLKPAHDCPAVHGGAAAPVTNSRRTEPAPHMPVLPDPQQESAMSPKKLWPLLAAAALSLGLAGCSKQEEAKVEKAAAEVKTKVEDAAKDAAKAAAAAAKQLEAREAAIDAYVYAYPLVTMEITRRVMTNVEKAEGSKAPMGQFARLRSYPAVDDHSVTAPNADTLYTLAWVDVGKEPWILSIPDMKDRFFLFPMLDMWTNVFQDPGKRTTGTKAQKYAITGPGWKGELPAGVTEYKSPTAIVWLLGRIYSSGTPEDYKAVHALQDQVSVVPLSAYGKPYTAAPGKVDAAIDMKTGPRDQVNAMDASAYFKLAAQLMKDNPPTAEDAPMVAKLAKLGIVPGQDFDAAKLDPAVLKGMNDAIKHAQGKISSLPEALALGNAKLENGWLFFPKAGVYGTNYLNRALITWYGLGANRPEDAVYPLSEGPELIKKFNGANKYVLRFEKGQLPPVKGFWSITMYDQNYFFVPNPINRYTVSSRSKFKANPDGSIDVYVQNESPGKDKEANWLPAPKGEFVLMMRLYWPSPTAPTILDGSWKPPRVSPAS
jgi:hypothetical protein